MRKNLGVLSGALALALVLTACGSDTKKPEDKSRMVRSLEESGIMEDWMGSGRYQADDRGRVDDSMSKKGRQITDGTQNAVRDARQGAMDAGRDVKQGAERAGQDLKRAAGK